MSLESKALNWLLYVHGSHFATMERGPRVWSCGKPDVIGITKGRRVTEIEIKRSMSDFRANANKRHIFGRTLLSPMHPYMYYFLVPEKLTEKVMSELPEWAGLMNDSVEPVKVIVKAPVNTSHRRLTLKESVHFARSLSNHLAALSSAMDTWKNHQYQDWGIEYHI